MNGSKRLEQQNRDNRDRMRSKMLDFRPENVTCYLGIYKEFVCWLVLKLFTI